MKELILSNLRQLSTEEQIRLNGGSVAGPCDAKCSCTCYCKCDNKNPKAPCDKEFSDSGYTRVEGAKQREAMLKW